jgi:uncharacterized membrane protein
MSRPGVPIVAVVLALLCAFVGAGVGGAAGAAGPQPAAFQTSGVETDAVVLQADVAEDGDADWTIEYRIRLDDENSTAAFESLQQDVEANSSTYTDQFAERMRSTVDAAESATGREMAVSNVTVSTRVSSFGNRYGVVSYQFVWEGFARSEGDRLVVGDALAGFFLDEDTRLSVSWPNDYEMQSVDPPADETGANSVTWVGPTEFTSGQPRLVAAAESPLPVSTPVAGAALLLLVAIVAGGVWFSRRGATGDDGPDGTDAPAAAAPESGTVTTSTGESQADTPASQARTETGTAAASENDAQDVAATGATAPAANGADEERSTDPQSTVSETPTELLSPEERVMRLLRERGGRMKQKTVTEELDWSAARTSQVVGGLRDDGQVESFRLGRENVLRLPDEDGEP